MNNNFQDCIDKLYKYLNKYSVKSYYNKYWISFTCESNKIINDKPTYYSNENEMILPAYSYILSFTENNNIVEFTITYNDTHLIIIFNGFNVKEEYTYSFNDVNCINKYIQDISSLINKVKINISEIQIQIQNENIKDAIDVFSIKPGDKNYEHDYLKNCMSNTIILNKMCKLNHFIFGAILATEDKMI
jgi:hypothetical protein